MKKIIIITAGILLFIVILVIVFFLEQFKKPKDNGILPTPTTSTNEKSITDPSLDYDKEGTDSLLRTVTTRPTASPDDKTARQKLLDRLDGKSGTLINTSTFTLEYSKAPDSFSAEIKSIEIEKTKKEVTDYLASQGFSNEGICKLPLYFYLSYDVSKSLKNETIKFNPSPDFCK